MVSEEGLEPPQYHYAVPDLQSGATPYPSLPFTHRGHTKNGVTDGARTRDDLDHNQAIYRLIYGHHPFFYYKPDASWRGDIRRIPTISKNCPRWDRRGDRDQHFRFED